MPASSGQFERRTTKARLGKIDENSLFANSLVINAAPLLSLIFANCVLNGRL